MTTARINAAAAAPPQLNRTPPPSPTQSAFVRQADTKEGGNRGAVAAALQRFITAPESTIPFHSPPLL